MRGFEKLVRQQANAINTSRIFTPELGILGLKNRADAIAISPADNDGTSSYKHYSLRAGQTDVQSLRLLVRWNGLRHPRNMGHIHRGLNCNTLCLFYIMELFTAVTILQTP
jgi:hypothetical protein